MAEIPPPDVLSTGSVSERRVWELIQARAGQIPSDYQTKDEKGQPDGYAPLGADGIVPAQFLPDSGGGTEPPPHTVSLHLEFDTPGTWDGVAATTLNVGDVLYGFTLSVPIAWDSSGKTGKPTCFIFMEGLTNLTSGSIDNVDLSSADGQSGAYGLNDPVAYFASNPMVVALGGQLLVAVRDLDGEGVVSPAAGALDFLAIIIRSDG